MCECCACRYALMCECCACRYALMCECWLSEPSERPTFTQLRDRLDTMIENYSPVQYMTFDPLPAESNHRSCDDSELINVDIVDDADDRNIFARPLRRSLSNHETTTSVAAETSGDGDVGVDYSHLRWSQLKLTNSPVVDERKTRMKGFNLQPLRVLQRSQDDVIVTSSSSMQQLLSRSSVTSSDNGYETQKSLLNLTSELTGETRL